MSAEVQANIRSDGARLIATRFTVGYISDDEGLINNYATEPIISVSAYSLRQQQRHYASLRTGTVLSVASIRFVALAAS
ncbi:ssl1498 family light-harvesting-like protein [Leptolyngbya sp. FACHB-541]|nr:ssl1498 family light-harvesting-like protein [Leptolyngbya sp. FACHB-541]